MLSHIKPINVPTFNAWRLYAAQMVTNVTKNEIPLPV